MRVVRAVVFLGIVAVSGYLVGWIAKDSADRLGEHDHHYCVAIEGHSEKECAEMGR